MQTKTVNKINIEEFTDLARESAIAGFYLYLSGGVGYEGVSDALGLDYSDADGMRDYCLRKIEGKTEQEARDIIGRAAFLFGIRRGFEARSSGKLHQNDISMEAICRKKKTT
jgi:hypothetical protein